MQARDERSSCPAIGDRFPDLAVHTTQGEIQLPQDYEGQWFIFFSHPGDFTPVCTTEYVAFQRLSDDFAKLNTRLIGLSIDQVQAHLKWLEWIGQNLGVRITFPLIADPMGQVAQALCLVWPGGATRTARTVFIVDGRGVIRLTLSYPAEVGRNVREILRAVQALQTADRCGGATPADWPQNELIGGRLIVPPAATAGEIGERCEAARAGAVECYDWWFCHKPPC